MVVDDDPDIVNYLRLLLTPHYRLFHAYDAASALESIRGEMPDLVMSDVAMPGMDGYQLCQTLKEDLTTCHIPVILVTAKTTTEEQIAGLNTGADAYVTKPFNPDYLLALIRSQLSNRERIRGILSQSTRVEAQAEQMLNTQDKQFMDELYTLMEQELSNPELNINSLTERLLMSRSKLNYKIKGLTGETPASFFRRFKLNKAAEMLREGSHSVSEVADLTGFSSPTVFSRNFKQQFGVTPSEFVSDAPQNQHPA
ncbi:MAG: response regulator [Bacteroidales bacterium]|nr:response regulator [Bacteroidales bacterium]